MGAVTPGQAARGWTFPELLDEWRDTVRELDAKPFPDDRADRRELTVELSVLRTVISQVEAAIAAQQPHVCEPLTVQPSDDVRPAPGCGECGHPQADHAFKGEPDVCAWRECKCPGYREPQPAPELAEPVTVEGVLCRDYPAVVAAMQAEGDRRQVLILRLIDERDKLRAAADLDLASNEMRPGELDATLATVPPCEEISSWGMRCRVVRAHETHRDRDGNMWPEPATEQPAPELAAAEHRAELEAAVRELVGQHCRTVGPCRFCDGNTAGIMQLADTYAGLPS